MKILSRLTIKSVAVMLLMLVMTSISVSAKGDTTGIKGDVNADGICDIRDLIAAQMPDLSHEQKKAADINGDDVVDGEDYTLIRQIILGTYSSGGEDTPSDLGDVIRLDNVEISENIGKITVTNISNVWETSEDAYLNVEFYDENGTKLEAGVVELGFVAAGKTKTCEVELPKGVTDIKVKGIVSEYWTVPVK